MTAEIPEDSDLEEKPVREWATYYPLFWFMLPEGPKRDQLRKEQEAPGFKWRKNNDGRT